MVNDDIHNKLKLNAQNGVGEAVFEARLAIARNEAAAALAAREHNRADFIRITGDTTRRDFADGIDDAPEQELEKDDFYSYVRKENSVEELLELSKHGGISQRELDELIKDAKSEGKELAYSKTLNEGEEVESAPDGRIKITDKEGKILADTEVDFDKAVSPSSLPTPADDNVHGQNK